MNVLKMFQLISSATKMCIFTGYAEQPQKENDYEFLNYVFNK